MAETEPNKVPTKGAGTSFWRLKEGETLDISVIADVIADEKWTQHSKVREITVGEMTAEDEEDNYLDDPDSDWVKTSPGQKTGGDISVVQAWLPGESAQQQTVADYKAGTITYYRVKYPNGTVDLYYGYINSIGKTVTIKDKMTRTIKIKQVGEPLSGEEVLVAVAEAAAQG